MLFHLYADIGISMVP